MSAQNDNTAMAINKNLKTSVQKLNLVAGSIRGKHVSDAMQALQFSPKKMALEVKKTLMSAVANAENNHGLDVDSLYVKEAFVGKNMVMKRFRARARGRGAKILKPFAQVTIIVEEREAA